ncbi:MAG: response regulator transcription factor [Opitutus sp.]
MRTGKPITILIAEDHSIVRQGLCSLFSADARLHVVARAKNGREAVRMALDTKPDVILMDISMPRMNGHEAGCQILAANPRAKILMLSVHTSDEYVEKMIKMGALGYLSKDEPIEVLLQAILTVASGALFLSADVSKRLLSERTRPKNRDGVTRAERLQMTSREREVLQLVAESMANKQIAAELAISTKTVEKHRQSVMDKLNIHDTAGLTRYAMTEGIIEIGAKLTVV